MTEDSRFLIVPFHSDFSELSLGLYSSMPTSPICSASASWRNAGFRCIICSRMPCGVLRQPAMYGSRCSPKKHWVNLKSGNLNTECTQLMCGKGSCTQCPVNRSYSIIFPPRILPSAEICQNTVAPCQYFDVPTRYISISRCASSLPIIAATKASRLLRS